MASEIIFDILGFVAVLGAIGVVLARNPVHSALSLVVTFLNVAAIYIILQAEFLAAVQVIVYTGAILVLVLFVIMLVHQENLPDFHSGQPVQLIFGFIMGVILLAEIATAIFTRTIVGAPGPWTSQAVASVGGNTQAIGRVLYSSYVLPIQATALVLLAATIGALVLARPGTPAARLLRPKATSTISLGHSRGSDMEDGYEEPALPAIAGEQLKPESGERDLVMAKSGDEFVEQPAWGEPRER